MRTIPFPKFADDAAADDWHNSDNARVCDNRNVQECLEDVDSLLAKHGLEVVLYDAIASDYSFDIRKRI